MVFPDIESGAGRKPMKNMAQVEIFFFFFKITSYISNQSYDGNQLTLPGFPLGPVSLDITI